MILMQQDIIEKENKTRDLNHRLEILSEVSESKLNDIRLNDIMESCLPNILTDILPLELRLLDSKWLILVTFCLLLKMNQLVSLKFKNYLPIITLHMIALYFQEILICHFLIKIWKIRVIFLNWTIPLKTQHVLKAQAPHMLIISILTKRQRFLIHLLLRLVFLNTIVWFAQCFAWHKDQPKFTYYHY